ncbi:sulfite exporter TauE/SafE family protein [Methylococcus sp. Mc7]|uniref:sulfite exporter TauE/SafE family protein n=1 Tax=Methylococcus sp. Mc7 TaxID=2860258 RepID=UPI002106E1F1|nr:sulfite exporter TauE/SafE family protein [Methylococcus sp. Mc7]
MTDMYTTLAFYLAFGAIAGVASGLFGIGGGAIIVPFLVWLFAGQGVPESVLMIMAVATSLATIVVTSVSSVRAHHRRGAVVWPLVWRLVPGIALGTVAGSIVADHLPTQRFKQLFAVFLMLVAVQVYRGRREETANEKPVSLGVLTGGGLVIGLLSALFGIGGGSITVPFLLRCRQNIRHAVGISSACGFPIAVVGTLSYVILGWDHPSLPAYSLGYIYWPAFLGIGAASALTAPYGAALAHRLPMQGLKRLFAAVLFLLGARMLWKSADPSGLGVLNEGLETAAAAVQRLRSFLEP